MSDVAPKRSRIGDGRVLGAAGGAVGLSAIAAMLGTCCVAPWAVSLIGVAGAVALARFSAWAPALIAGAVLLLGLAFYFAYRPRPACMDGSCDATSQRRLRWVAWVGALVVAPRSRPPSSPTCETLP
jgi:hypothetical protein